MKEEEVHACCSSKGSVTLTYYSFSYLHDNFSLWSISFLMACVIQSVQFHCSQVTQANLMNNIDFPNTVLLHSLLAEARTSFIIVSIIFFFPTMDITEWTCYSD